MTVNFYNYKIVERFFMDKLSTGKKKAYIIVKLTGIYTVYRIICFDR